MASYSGADAAEQGGAPNPSEAQPACAAAPPVNCYSGAFWYQFTDVSLPEAGDPLELTRTYSSAAAVDSPFGRGWAFTYGMAILSGPGAGQLTVRQEDGSTVTFSPDPGGASYRGPARVLASLVRRGDGTFLFTRGSDDTSFVFAAAGQLQSRTDGSGEKTVISPGPKPNQFTVRHNSRFLTFTYCPDDGGPSCPPGHIGEVVDPNGRKVGYTYLNGELQRAILPGALDWTYSYLGGNKLNSLTELAGPALTVYYGADGRVSEVDDNRKAARTRWSYDGVPFVDASVRSTVTDPAGHPVAFQFMDGLLASVSVGSGARASTTSYLDYTSSGQPQTVIDPMQQAAGAARKVTSYVYDDGGHVLSTTDTLGRTTTYTYRPDGRPLTVTAPDHAVSTLVYDSAGKLVQGIDADGNITAYTVDPEHPDKLASVEDPIGNVTTFTYDADGDLLTSVQERGGWNETVNSYGGDGELVCQALTTGTPRPNCSEATGATQYRYEATGRLGTVDNSDDDAPATSVTYGPGAFKPSTGTGPSDAVGLATTVRDPNGYLTTTTDNTDGLPLSTTRADVTVGVQTTYYPDGSPRIITDAGGDKTKLTYDDHGRIDESIDPIRGTVRYTYDLNDNVTAVQHSSVGMQGRPTTVSYTYDAANELTDIVYSDGRTPAVSFTYTMDGQRATMTVHGGTDTVHHYQYDCDGRLTDVAEGQAAPTPAPAADCARSPQAGMYTYDGDGRLTGLTYAPGQHITRDYHDEGRFVKVSDWLGNTTTFYYTQAGILNEVDYPNGTCAARDSDTVVLTRCGDKKKGIAAFTYHRNNDGQVISAKASIAGTGNGRDDVFGYSATGALNLVKSPRKNAPDGRYRYDAIGDLTEFPDGTTFAVAGGQIQSRQTAAGDLLTGFHYNSAGDRTSTVTSSGTSIDLSYDQAERLTGYGGQVQYTYDGDGLLATRTAAGHTTSFTWDRSAQTPLLLSDGTAQYIYGPDGQPFEQIVGSQITYLLTDAQNSVRLLTDSKGKVAGSYSYSPYGHVDHRTGKTTTALQFDSQYTDQACGCQYLRNRFYDLDTAEFLTPDPDLNETGTPYGFAAGDPLDRADPTGQFPKWLGITLLTVAFIAVTVLTDGADLPELGALEELNGARTLGQLERIGESGARAAEEEAASDGATSAATTGTARTATTRIQFGPLKIERTTTDTRPVVLDASQQEASRAAGTSNSSLFGRVFTTDRKNNIKKRLKNPLFWAGAAGKAHGVYQACVGQNTDAANCASSIL